MSKRDMLARLRAFEDAQDEDTSTDEALAEAGLTAISPPDEQAAQDKHEQLKSHASGKKATLDDDGNLQREPTDAHRDLWRDDE